MHETSGKHEKLFYTHLAISFTPQLKLFWDMNKNNFSILGPETNKNHLYN